MDLINELRMLAEDLHVNGYNKYSAAMSKAADKLAKWEAVFGHLGDTPDECGNAIIAARDELEERCAALTDDGDALRLAVKIHMFDGSLFDLFLKFRLEETLIDGGRSDEEIIRRAIVRVASSIGGKL